MHASTKSQQSKRSSKASKRVRNKKTNEKTITQSLSQNNTNSIQTTLKMCNFVFSLFCNHHKANQPNKKNINNQTNQRKVCFSLEENRATGWNCKAFFLKAPFTSAGDLDERPSKRMASCSGITRLVRPWFGGALCLFWFVGWNLKSSKSSQKKTQTFPMLDVVFYYNQIYSTILPNHNMLVHFSKQLYTSSNCAFLVFEKVLLGEARVFRSRLIKSPQQGALYLDAWHPLDMARDGSKRKAPGDLVQMVFVGHFLSRRNEDIVRIWRLEAVGSMMCSWIHALQSDHFSAIFQVYPTVLIHIQILCLVDIWLWIRYPCTLVNTQLKLLNRLVWWDDPSPYQAQKRKHQQAHPPPPAQKKIKQKRPQTRKNPKALGALLLIPPVFIWLICGLFSKDFLTGKGKRWAAKRKRWPIRK